jgi:hypothetical protein
VKELLNSLLARALLFSELFLIEIDVDAGGLNHTQLLPSLEAMVRSELGTVVSNESIQYAEASTRLHLRAVPLQGSVFSAEDMTALVADFFDVEHNAVQIHASNPVGSRIPQRQSIRIQGATSATKGCPITIEFPTGRQLPISSNSDDMGLLELPKLVRDNTSYPQHHCLKLMNLQIARPSS